MNIHKFDPTVVYEHCSCGFGLNSLWLAESESTETAKWSKITAHLTPSMPYPFTLEFPGLRLCRLWTELDHLHVHDFAGLMLSFHTILFNLY